MTLIFGIPIQAFLGQLLIGLINGSFYALLSLVRSTSAPRAPTINGASTRAAQ